MPAVYRALLDYDESVPLSTSSLRMCVSAGEALPPATCRAWKEAFGDRIRLLNAYGPTECSDDVTHHFIREAREEETRTRYARQTGL